jgi:hypothetical protein
MESKLNKQNEEDYSNVFSQISGNKKMGNISQLKNNLSDLQQSVSLLKYYATKGKIKSKNNKIKILSPVNNQTQQKITNTNPKTKTTRGILKNIRSNIDLDIKLKNSEKMKKPKVKISQPSTNENTKTQFPKIKIVDKEDTNKNIFNTNIDYKENKNDVIKIITSTNNKKSESNSRPKNNNILPLISQTNSTSKDISIIKPKKSKNIDNDSINNSNDISIIDSRNKSSSLNKNKSFNREYFGKAYDCMIKNMKRDNNNVKKKIYRGIEKFNIMEWYMKTRFKYAEYKYGIAEVQKYFMDLKAYGKPEEEEIDKRKTFYEHVEDIIDDIHAIQQKKQMEKLNKKYGIEHDKKKLSSRKEKSEYINPHKKKMIEVSRALQQINRRKKMEKKKREEIENILFKCKHRIHSIDSFESKLPIKD